MDHILFNDISIRGIVGNRTTRHLIPTSILAEYTLYCEQLVSRPKGIKPYQLYECASGFWKIFCRDSGKPVK